MMDHIMNNRLSLEFGQHLRPHSTESVAAYRPVGNALDMDWRERCCRLEECSYMCSATHPLSARNSRWRTKRSTSDDMDRGFGERNDRSTGWIMSTCVVQQSRRDYASENPSHSTDCLRFHELYYAGRTVPPILWPVVVRPLQACRSAFAHRTFASGAVRRGARLHVHCRDRGARLSPGRRRAPYFRIATMFVANRMFLRFRALTATLSTARNTPSPALFGAGRLADPGMTDAQGQRSRSTG